MKTSVKTNRRTMMMIIMIIIHNYYDNYADLNHPVSKDIIQLEFLAVSSDSKMYLSSNPIAICDVKIRTRLVLELQK